MKICEYCQKNPASIFFTQVDGEEMVSRHICVHCAEAMGIKIPEQELEFDEDGEEVEEFSIPMDVEEDEVECTRCGKKEKEFMADFKAGCIKCYSVFENHIDKRVHVESGPTFYGGKQYKQAGSRAFQSELNYLKAELDSAVKQQKFELASVLRDRVKELENRADR